MGTTIDDMQVGCLWQNNHLLSVSLSGNINYLDRENPSTPLRVIKVSKFWLCVVQRCLLYCYTKMVVILIE